MLFIHRLLGRSVGLSFNDLLCLSDHYVHIQSSTTVVRMTAQSHIQCVSTFTVLLSLGLNLENVKKTNSESY